MLEEARFFERFGIGFGEDESYRIFKSLCVHLIFIQKFSLAKKARETRFWGKIMGSEKDYYIIEAAADGGEEAT